MNFWSPIPFIRICLCFIVGIILFLIFPYQLSSTLAIISFSLFIFFAFILNRKLAFRLRLLPGVFVILTMLMLGYFYTELRQEITDINHYKSIISEDKPDYAIVKLLENPEEKENSYKTIAEILSVKTNNEWYETKGKLLLYFEKHEDITKLHYGDLITIHSRINEVNPPANPNEFDYKTYLKQKKIYYQSYLKIDSWRNLNENRGNLIVGFAQTCRNYLLNVLNSNNIVGEEYAVASAIMLGYSDKIDAKLLKKYSEAGAMHVLCVSGLHVGVIFVIFSAMLFFIGKTKRGKFIKSILLILMIWSYALITGLSPSVMRASTMFTLIAIGQNLGRESNIFNTLSASAFILLLIDPMILLDLGFQLSYTAVLGIVIIQPPLYKLFLIKNKVLDKVWAITVVSIAAQIGTLPIALYYFNQFPNYFILTNLLVIPLSGLIIYTGMAVMVSSVFSYLSQILGIIMSFLIKIMNSGVSLIESLPCSVTSSIFLTSFEMLMLYILIISVLLMFFIKKKKYIFLVLLIAIIFGSSISIKKIINLSNRQLIIYSVKNATAIEFISGREAIFLCDTVLLNDKVKQSFFLKGNRLANNISNVSDILIKDTLFVSDYLWKDKEFIQFYDKRIAIVNKENYYLTYSEIVDVDYVVVSDNVLVNTSRIMDKFSFDLLIIDSSNSYYRAKEWKEKCITDSLNCYSVLHQGAFVIDL